MGATVLDGAVIGKGSLIGAHALVTQKQIIPPGVMVMGSPAKVTRHLRPEEKLKTVYWAHKYVEVAVAHAKKMKDNS
jgi:carbonic anhydrase/acetyltransferase-like protein (isoleucine patch superfamily)